MGLLDWLKGRRKSNGLSQDEIDDLRGIGEAWGIIDSNTAKHMTLFSDALEADFRNHEAVTNDLLRDHRAAVAHEPFTGRTFVSARGLRGAHEWSSGSSEWSVDELHITATDNASKELGELAGKLKSMASRSSVVECHYCGTQYHAGERNKCENCGAPLKLEAR